MKAMTQTGGGFLVQATAPETMFTPEDFSEEQVMIREMTEQFVENEVLPEAERIEHKEWDVTVRLLRRCAELGLLGIEVPSKYGGEELDKVSAMIVAEKMARVASFAVSYGGHSGIGTLPIVYFGKEEHKRRYLPLLCKGERISAYALSESGSGSDALSARTSAVRSADGAHWVVNGEKMWITNAAFADLFITFGQVDGNQFTCFIVEKDYPGVSTGAEENKMGLRGSSTRPLILTNAQIPIENVVGEIGKGHRVAFNILNGGRAKLAAGAVGSAKTALADAVQYAKQRVAFGRPIASFGAIQHKLAEMAIRIWAAEGMVYRTAGLMDDRLDQANPDDALDLLKAMEEYAIECSMLKVFGSEALDFVVDEAVQIYGGYGYSAEYPIERYYRDSRVNRIFEGTNEINRLVISTMLLKRSDAGRLQLQSSRSSPATSPAGPLAAEQEALNRAKQAALFTAAAAKETFGETIRQEQEVLMHVSDMLIQIYAMDTAIHRVLKNGGSSIHQDAARTLVNDAISRIEFSARQALAAISEGEALRAQLATVQRALAWTPIDSVRARRRIAEFLIDGGRREL